MFSGVLNKCSGLFPAHVLLQNLRLGSEQVDHDQAVDDAAESLVDVEARQTAAALEVWRSSTGAPLPSGSISSSSCETSSRSASRARSPLSAANECVRRRPILATDTDRAEQHVIARIAGDVLRDAFPQQQQCTEIPLIRSADERTSELERRPERAQERIAVGEQRMRVQAALAPLGDDLIDGPDAIRTDHFIAGPVPRDQVHVVPIVAIDVAVTARAFADGSRCW